MGFGTKDALVARLHANLYRTPAPPVGSAAWLKTRLSAADSGKPPGWAVCGIGFTLSNSLLIITAALAGSCGTILSSIIAQVRRWNAPCHDRTNSEAYRMRQDREQRRQV